jgi:hypothetical protein
MSDYKHPLQFRIQLAGLRAVVTGYSVYKRIQAAANRAMSARGQRKAFLRS